MKARLMYIPGSHPAMAARLMLERKGVPYRRVDVPPAVSRALVRAAGFKGSRVPAMWLDGRRIQGSRAIARALEEAVPEPRLFPEDPERRTRVEEAERWGDEELQQDVRTLLWWALKKRPGDGGSYLEGARLGMPVSLAGRLTPAIARLGGRLNAADEDNVRAILGRLPGRLDHADELVTQGVIGGDEPNAADYQVLTSIRLLSTLDDMRPAVEGRPCGEAAMRVVPDYPGRVGSVLPGEWITPATGGAAPAS